MFQKFGSTLPQSLVDAASSISEAKVEPAKPDAEAIARRKRLQALKDKQEDDAAETSYKKDTNVRKVAGQAYGGAKQKDDEVNEEVEELDELSKKTLGSYIKKASSSSDDRSNSNLASRAAYKAHTVGMDGPDDDDDGEKDDRKSFMRSKGIGRAVDRLTKEDLDEGDSGAYDPYDSKHPKFKANYDRYKKHFPDHGVSHFVDYMKKPNAETNLRMLGKQKITKEDFDIVEFVEALNEMDEYEIDEVINEVLGKDASAGDYIKDFTQSDNPKFKGKSKAQRKKMALAAYYGKQKNEELKGNQHKIDANKNGKVDAHDFKLLRAKKKVDEETEEQKKAKQELDSKLTKWKNQQRAGKAVDDQEKKLKQEELELVLDLTEGKVKEKDDVPFDEDPPKKSAVAGKKGYGPSAARHLARLGLKGAEKKKKDETYMGKAATSEEVVDERVMTPGTGTSPDPLVARTGISRDLKKPAEKARAQQNLKTAIKSTVANKEHGKSKLPENTEIEESRGHKIVARKLADIASRGPLADKLKDKQNIDKVEIVHQKDTAVSHPNPKMHQLKDDPKLNKKTHGFGNVVHKEETEIEEATRIQDTQGGYNLKKGSKQSAADRKDAASVVKDFRAKWRAKGLSTKRYDTNAQMDRQTGFAATKEQVEIDEADDKQYTHQVVHAKTGNVVGKYTSLKSASRAADKKDASYGGVAHVVKPIGENVELDETASLDQYIKSMGYDPEHTPKDKKVMFSKTNAFKTWASARSKQESKTPGQDDDNHMSPGATARG
jgi:hypothetical protein